MIQVHLLNTQTPWMMFTTIMMFTTMMMTKRKILIVFNDVIADIMTNK